MLQYIGVIAEFIALLVAIVCYHSIQKSLLKWTVPFLMIVLFGELVTQQHINFLTSFRREFHFLIAVCEAIYYGYVFYHLSTRHSLRQLIILFVLTSITVYLVTYTFAGSNFSYFIFELMLFGFLLTAIALAYLYEEFKKNDKVVFIHLPGFWVAVGVSLFYSSISLSLSFYNIINTNGITVGGIGLVNFITRMASVILYLCISISIILCKQNGSESSLSKTVI